MVGDRAALEFTDLSPAAPPNAKHPLVEALIASGVGAVEPKQAWTDVARFATVGMPALNFGPGDPAQAHQVDERISVAALKRGRSLLHAFLSV